VTPTRILLAVALLFAVFAVVSDGLSQITLAVVAVAFAQAGAALAIEAAYRVRPHVGSTITMRLTTRPDHEEAS
jgi:hypothetical protein